jgi:hypothetical protein
MTPEQREELADSQTIFALACLAVDMYVATEMKNKPMIANSFLKLGVVLRNNPGFVARLKKEQKDIMEHMKQMSTSKILTPETAAQAVRDTANGETHVES